MSSREPFPESAESTLDAALDKRVRDFCAEGYRSYDDGDYEQALRSALFCPRTVGNPFVHLRLGQCYLEMDKTEDADRHLARALYSGGTELFDKEPLHYLDQARIALKRLQSDRESAEIIFLGGDWLPDAN